jgi:hypothetical protein
MTTPITPLPDPPSIADPDNFESESDTFITALPTMVDEINVVAAAFNLNATSGTSLSSLAIGTGAKSFTADLAKSWLPGMFLVAADAAAPSTNCMLVQVTSYNSGTGALVTNSLATLGSGTKASWVISQTANPIPLDGSVSAASLAAALISGLTAETAPAIDDLLMLSDSSVSALRKMTLTNLLKVINLLTEDTSPITNTDYVLTYDASASDVKKVLAGRLTTPTNGVGVSSTSGTAVNFTSIPAWAKKITLSFAGVSISGTNDILIRLGDSGGLEATGYLSSSSLSGTSSVATINSTTDFRVTSGANAAIWHGSVTFTLLDSGTNHWVASGAFARSDAERVLSVAGSKALSGALDRVGVLPSGADTFDAGSINIQYE